jgi:ABC-2 type transport system ATP-binding protein
LNADTPRDGGAVVVIDQLTKKYGSFTALDHLTLSLDRGRILGFIGPNGAGKTTTIKILVGLARPSSGTAHIAGADCTRDSRKIKRLVGYMPDTFGSYDNMRVREYLDFFGAAFGIWRKQRRIRIDQVMDITGSTYMKDKYVESLSHGMKQRVGVARTLLHDPQVLILDEPAGGLDPQARIEMRELLVQLARMGKTLIVTSHILPDLSRICDRIAIITQGKLRAFGTLEEIMRRVSPLRMMEVQLSAVEQLEQAKGIVTQHLEDGAAVSVAAAEAAVRFKTARSDDEVGAVLLHLVTAGVRVNQFREVQTDLEDTFLSITRNADRPNAVATEVTEHTEGKAS